MTACGANAIIIDVMMVRVIVVVVVPVIMPMIMPVIMRRLIDAENDF